MLALASDEVSVAIIYIGASLDQLTVIQLQHTVTRNTNVMHDFTKALFVTSLPNNLDIH